VDYLQEHDVEMAITINEDDKTWVRRTIARAGGSTATSTPWPQWLEYVRLWSVPTIAVALLIFTLNEWSKYIEFRTHTNDALQTIQDALHVVQISRAADTPTSPSSQAEAKAVIAQARKNPSRPLPIPIIEHAGTQFVNAAPSDPNAWNVALDFAAYRTSENRERSLGDYYPFDSKNNPRLAISRFAIHYPLDKGPPAFTTSKARVPVSQSARLEPIGEPTKQDGPDGPFSILGVGGAIELDGVNARHVVFQGTEIYYNGGPLNLYEVAFVNCLFHLENNPSTRAFAQVVLTAPTINFEPTHF
jgi:hypothetical protein